MRRLRTTERGTVTLWVLGLCVCVFFLGGMSLDLWRGITVRRELQSMADAAAIAGADGVSEASLRSGGADLDPALVRQLAYDNLDQQSGAATLDAVAVTVAGNQVEVRLEAHVRMSLLGVFAGDRRLDVAVHASAEPRRAP